MHNIVLIFKLPQYSGLCESYFIVVSLTFIIKNITRLLFTIYCTLYVYTIICISALYTNYTIMLYACVCVFRVVTQV